MCPKPDRWRNRFYDDAVEFRRFVDSSIRWAITRNKITDVLEFSPKQGKSDTRQTIDRGTIENTKRTCKLIFDEKKRCPWRGSVSNERLDDAEDERGVTTSPADRRSRSPPGMETDRQASSRTWGPLCTFCCIHTQVERNLGWNWFFCSDDVDISFYFTLELSILCVSCLS